MKFKKLAAHYVWCDIHCGIHDAKTDAYDEGDRDCRRSNWRRVYVETDDRDEEF